MDLADIFDFEPCYCRNIISDVLLNWITKGDIDDLNMTKYVRGERAMVKGSHGFAKWSCGN